MDLIVAALKKLKIEHSPKKCPIIMVSKKGFHSKCYPQLKIQGKTLKKLEPCKYLGVTFGKSLSTSDHVNRLCDNTTKYQRNKLVMAQRYALLRIVGTYRTTSAESLHVILGTLPIDLECEKAAAMYKVRKRIEVELDGVIIPPRNANIGRKTPQGEAYERMAKKIIMDVMINRWQKR